MSRHRLLNFTISFIMIFGMVFGGAQQASAIPAGPTDPFKVPHYFGPYPNWANSPYTLPDVTVTIVGDGSGAAAVASIDGTGAIIGITITNPGVGYTTATVDITSATGIGAAATANLTTSGIVTGVRVDAGGSGYTAPTVTFDGGGGTGTLVQVGNPLIDRAFATDATAGTLVVLTQTLPTGQLQSFQALNQAASATVLTPSAGLSFNAYVLRPTGIAGGYTVLFDSGLLTVPALTNTAVSEMVNYPVTPVAVLANDVIGFYGMGIPHDTAVGTDITSFPVVSAPVLASVIILGSPVYPIVDNRTYSFSASVVDTSAVAPLTNATATVYGGVGAVTITDFGFGYTMPTIDLDMPDAPDGVQATGHVTCNEVDCHPLNPGEFVTITGVVIDNPGSGYSTAPNVVIRDGTVFDPILGSVPATATATLSISSIVLVTFGSGYTAAPTVTINDLNAIGASATAFVNAGGVTSITVDAPGTGYITQGGIKKFQDGLPLLCMPTPDQTFADCVNNNLGQHIPVGVPDTTTFTVANGFANDADFYVIALVQTREQMSSSLPVTGTLLREYVQLETAVNFGFSKHVLLVNELKDGTNTPALLPNNTQAIAVDNPHFLGPIIVANKNKPVRIVFYNLLPAGAEGDLFLPVDSTIMGSGMGPMPEMAPMEDGSVMDEVRNPACSESPKPAMGCFKENRATLHLHGGISPWISDGTPHQWITPANEMTEYPAGVSVSEVPDMNNSLTAGLGVPDCTAANDGCMTFYYTNQQSARLMFYHDHSWGITRLNVYAGEAAGYVITDATEQKLISAGGALAGLGVGIPLIIQDRTFVPSPAQIAEQDPTWDYTRWGDYGDLWYHHVYMPAQNPGDPGGMSAYGRWMYGPWFWPPAIGAVYGPISNPYYDATCDLDNPATWTYQTDPFCEPALIPGTPNISAGMEQFNDTPLVNGTAYPKTTVDPKSYRFRILNAANDRFWNLQWYVADPTTGTLSEVAFNPAELAAAQTDPNIFPTPLKSMVNPATGLTVDLSGPDWIQIGTEGGFLPAPVVIDGQQFTTWVIDPTRFDVGTVDLHSLLLGPAERADVIVDFSRFAGKTLILYNDAPAAFPARVASYDYYTGQPDMSPNGPAAIIPGYGPNTRTIMQVTVAAGPAAAPFNLTALNAAFRHHADGSGVFESGQHPIIVGQAAYNSAYGTNFVSAGYCNAPTNPSARCDGFLRINEQGGNTFKFNTLRTPNTKLGVKIEPKALHDEMNSTSFDEFGRMSSNLGLEAVPATPGLQNVILYPFVNPATELINATNLPTTINVTAISSGTDGTQIWKFTHNGVDTHPIHFHLFDVQLINRVTWDNIVIPPDKNELGWKDTLRISPLMDTIVAVRAIMPVVPFEVPNSIRPLNPMMPLGSQAMFNNTDAQGIPTTPIINSLVNHGWEYMYHCHILSHEEMDMMRPVIVAVPPYAPSGLNWSITGTGTNTRVVLTWDDNSITETAFVIERNAGTGWTTVGTVVSPLDVPNIHQPRTFTDITFNRNNTYQYRVVAQNAVGYGGAYMSMTVQSVSGTIFVGTPPNAPSNFNATLQAGPQVRLTWNDNSTNETGFVIERQENGGSPTIINVAANVGVYVDLSVVPGSSYTYRVAAVNLAGTSTFTNVRTINIVIPPAAPSNLTGTRTGRSVSLTWLDNSTNEIGFRVQMAWNATFTSNVTNSTLGANTTSFTRTNLQGGKTYFFRVQATNSAGPSGWSNTFSIFVP